MFSEQTHTGRSRHRLLRAVLACLLCGIVPIGAGVASAQEGATDATAEQPAPVDAGFTVQPSGPNGPGARDWFTYSLDPGAVFGDVVAVSNLSDKPIRFAIFPTDAVSVIDVGGFAALRDDETPVDVGTWITLAEGDYVVEPGQRIDVPFSIAVPDDAEPGDHAGAILAVDADQASFDPNADPGGLGFNVRNRLGARVYVRVSGPVNPALRIDELDVVHKGNTATVNWEVVNTGNLRLAPSAQVRITGIFGRTVRTMPAQALPELLPGANYVGASVVPDLPSLEPLTARLVVTADDVRTERSNRFESYPWLLIALVLSLLLAAGWWYRRRHRPPPETGTPPARRTDRVPVGS